MHKSAVRFINTCGEKEGMAKRLELETLAEVYTKLTSLVSGAPQGKTYRFDSGTGHVSYQQNILEYDGEKCRITAQPDIVSGIDCFRIDYVIYPSTVLTAVEKGKKGGKTIDQIFSDLVPKTPLRKEVLTAGFEPTEEDGAECTLNAYDVRHIYALIESYIKNDPMYKGDKKTFISERKQQAKHERGKRRPASDVQYARDNHCSEPEQPTAEPTGSDSEPPSIAV